MSEDKVYKDGDIVWVKLGNNWWPGEVTGPARHPEGLIKHLKRVPYCVVKFFNENTYEYVRSSKQIFPFQCAKQEEFIRKGYSLFNSGNSFMEKFPTDVEVAKKLTHRKEPSFIINDRPDSIVKAILGQPLIHTYDNCYDGSEYREKRRSGDSITRILNITQNHNEKALSNEMSKTQTSVTKSIANSTTTNNSNYECNLCDFSSVRLNVMILHRKMHSNRNSLEPNKSTSSKPTNAKSPPVGTPTTTRTINDTNQLQQIEMIKKNKNISKTKLNTNQPTARTSALLTETTKTITPVINLNNIMDVTKTTSIPLTPKGKDNRLTTLQTSTHKSKPAKKATEKEKKEDNAYASILLDFCPSETEPSPTLEEKQSRRSLRNGKNINKDAAESVPPICIDLSETKNIQKIPKKREYFSLQSHTESFPQVTASITDSEPDVVCLGDKETATSGSSNKYSETSKRDAEDIRRMLLADWSDDDEIPTDAIVLEDSIAVENTESNECIYSAVNDLHNSVAAVKTSTPVFKPSTTSTGRIRNIPKKDRRDVVLQDFNSDLSIIQNDNVEQATKTVAVDLDSSNSSIVEIIEDKQAATIITINDDEEQEVSKSQKCQTELAANESKDSDSAVGIINDKSASAATSTTSLSCFDFQEDEDNTAATISHFKKKYLSGDRLQNLSSVPTDDSNEYNIVKSRAELAEKDERLAAEIETLLEQTQPLGTDLLNVNSFEESISVKDLPIKERGKRIFKSRNKSRVEDKNNKELVPIVETTLAQSVDTIEEYKSNESSIAITEIVDTDKIITEPEHEITTDVEVRKIPEHETLTNNKSLVEVSSTITETPKFLDNTHFRPNENKENDISLETNKNCLEVSVFDENRSEYQKQQMKETKGLAPDRKDENIDSEKTTKSIVTEEHENNKRSFCSSNQYLNKPDDQQQRTARNSLEQEIVFATAHTEAPSEKDLGEESVITKDMNLCKEKCQEIETINNSKKPSLFFEKEDIPVNNDIATETESLQISKKNFKNDFTIEMIGPRVPDEVINYTLTDQKELKALTPETAVSTTITTKTSDEDGSYKNQQQCLENVSKIRVKSPDQLFDQAFVIAPQQEPELQPAVDNNVDARLITTTPTDENSSMGASDTGAEFGSPTSMLSEERLPAFRFQGNQTPQQEIETAETELPVHPERDQKKTNIDADKSPSVDQVKDKFLKNKLQIHKYIDQKILQQRRFSMDLISLQTEPKSSKRQRLSVDEITINQENNFERPQERLKLLTTNQNRTDEKVRPKSRHMKITPRRNVSELFKVHSPSDKNMQKNVQKSCSLESVEETVECLVSTTEEQQLKNESNISLNQGTLNEPSHEVLKKITETKQQVEMDPKSNSNNTAINEVTVNKGFKNYTDKEELISISENRQENGLNSKLMPTSISVEKLTEVDQKEELNPKVEVQTESKLARSPNKTTTSKIENVEETSTNQSSKQNELKSRIFDDNISNIETNNTTITEDTSNYQSFIAESPKVNIVRNLNYKDHVDVDLPKIPIIPEDRIEDIKTNEATPSTTGLLDCSKQNKDHESETVFSPGIPPPTPQEREVVIESENLNQALDISQDVLTNIEEEIDMTVFPLTPKDKENSNEFINQPLTPQVQDQHIKETHDPQEATEENRKEKDIVSLTILGKELIAASNDCPFISKTANNTSACESLAEPSTPQLPSYTETDLETKMTKEKTGNYECENIIQIPSTPQARDLIIECEPLTPQGIIECDHNIPAQVTPEKEIIIESHQMLTTPSQDKDIIVDGNLRLEKKETLLREFQIMQPKENATSVVTPQESQTNVLQTDADKAAEEFLIEFDSIVNHSHTVDEDLPRNTVEDAIIAEDLINNIIEEVHEDQHIKQDEPAKCESSLQYEPITTYTVVAPKNSWNQIFKESFNRQLPPAKRRQTICFEISDTKEGVACKKQAFDFESVLPVNKAIKRTAERKLTLPPIETKLSNSYQPHNIFAINHNQLTLNKKLIPTSKRKLSIEDNITSFIIERPKQPQQPANSASGPPPLQRIRNLNRQRQQHTNSRASIDIMSEPPPLQSNDSLFNELFPLESSSPTPCTDISQKAEGGRVIHQQIISTPTVSTIPQNKTTDAKISKNKQIGIDSRGNKYVIIKTPQTDIVVQPTLTSSSATTVTASNNFGTTITIQPLARSTTEISVTKPTTKSKNISLTPTTSPCKQQIPQKQMKHISITVPAKSTLDSSLEGAAKIQPRARRKTSHAKAIASAATATASNNINSAKHRQAMEALSRRLSLAAETPPVAKISRASTNVIQTQISNNNNLTFFGDTQISNIAQQQLIQLQQQQQTQTLAPQVQPPIILNKHAHQQSVMQRKTRKIPYQQQQQKQYLQHQQIATAKSSHLQQQSHIQQHQHQQQIQQQTVTQITSQQQSQQNNALHPPPLHQIQAPTLPMQQQIVQQTDGIIITTAATEDDNVIDSNTQLIALPTQPYPGYSETFLLCKVKGNTCKPVDNVPLYLNHQLNELVPVPLEALEGGHKPQQHQIEIKAPNASQHLLAGQTNEPHNSECNLQIANLNCNLVEAEISAGIVDTDQQMQQHNQQQQAMKDCLVDETGASTSSNQINNFAGNQEVNTELVSNNGILLNIEGQQVLLDAATFAHLLANPEANTQLISDDGTEYVLTHEVLAALQMQQEQQALELANAAAVEQQQHHQQLDQSGSSDIIAVALAGSDLYDNDVLTIDTSQGMQLIDSDGSIVFPTHTGAITQQHLTPPAVVTNAVLDQSPIMSTLEVPSSIAAAHKLQGDHLITVPSHHLATSSNAALGVGGRTNLEDSLAAIGVTTQSSSIPSSLGLPITVTNPNIASKVTSAGPLNEMLQFVSHRPATAAATAAAVAAAALAGESRIFTD